MVAKIKVKVSFDVKKIRKKVRQGNTESLFRAGFFVRREARKKLLKHKKKLVVKVIDGKERKVRQPSEPGSPPRTTGALRDAIKFEVAKQKDDVIIGPDSGNVSNVGKAHEFGGSFRGQNYPKRAFMGPALDKVRSRLPRLWSQSIK